MIPATVSKSEAPVVQQTSATEEPATEQPAAEQTAEEARPKSFLQRLLGK